MLSILDHFTIHRFLYSFLKINLKRTNFEKTLFFNKTKLIKFLINGYIVSPNYINVYWLIGIVKHAKLFTARSNDHLEGFVSFTRILFQSLKQGVIGVP